MNRLFNRLIWPIMLAPVAYLLIIWKQLPETVAMHFNWQGVADRFGNKKELIALVALMTGVNIGVYLLLTNIHRIDPKKYALNNRERLGRIAFAVAVFLAGLTCLIIYTCQAGSFETGIPLMMGGVGLLLAIIGNYMPNLKPNYFAGIRLPWTLENEDNWRKTHQLAGKYWFFGGLLIAVICPFLPASLAIATVMLVVLIVSVIPSVYSYRLFRQGRK